MLKAFDHQTARMSAKSCPSSSMSILLSFSGLADAKGSPIGPRLHRQYPCRISIQSISPSLASCHEANNARAFASSNICGDYLDVLDGLTDRHCKEPIHVPHYLWLASLNAFLMKVRSAPAGDSSCSMKLKEQELHCQGVSSFMARRIVPHCQSDIIPMVKSFPILRLRRSVLINVTQFDIDHFMRVYLVSFEHQYLERPRALILQRHHHINAM